MLTTEKMPTKYLNRKRREQRAETEANGTESRNRNMQQQQQRNCMRRESGKKTEKHVPRDDNKHADESKTKKL